MAGEDAKATHGNVQEAEEAEEETVLAQTLLECVRQLEALCGQLGVDADNLASHTGSGGTQFEANELWENDECDGGDEEGEKEGTDSSAMRIAEECMAMLTSMESIRLDEHDGEVGDAERGQVERRQALMMLDGDREQSGSTDAQVKDETDGAISVTQELLGGMNALSDELSAFTLLMLESAESSSGCDEETPLMKETQEAEPEAHSDLPGATVMELPVHNVQVESATEAQPPVLDAVLPVQSIQPLSQIRGQTPSSLPRAQSNYQKMLRANPPKPTRVTQFRGKTNERGRPKQQQQLHTKMREILSSPMLWKEYQSKSFQQHIKRQQHARHLAEQESLLAEQAAAAHFKRAQYALKLSRGCPERRASGGVRSPKAVYDTSYLRRFWENHRGLPPPPQEVERQHASPVSSPKGLLCGVYVYSKRQLGLAYFTCLSLAQLEERVCLRFGISSVLNLYREQVTSTKQPAGTGAISGRKRSNRIRTFQRITLFDQVQDGDRICATQDAYEDMAILCEWIKHRQQQIYHMRPGPPPKPAPLTSATVQQRSELPSKASISSIRGPALTTTTAQHEENASLWDANGRCVAVKKQLIV